MLSFGSLAGYSKCLRILDATPSGLDRGSRASDEPGGIGVIAEQIGIVGDAEADC
ncbi:MAG: hypothetical protein ACM37W_10040 [Actinomycetota bacterium]